MEFNIQYYLIEFRASSLQSVSHILDLQRKWPNSRASHKEEAGTARTSVLQHISSSASSSGRYIQQWHTRKGARLSSLNQYEATKFSWINSLFSKWSSPNGGAFQIKKRRPMICSHIPRFSLPWCSIPQVHQRESNSFAAVTCPRSCMWD